MVVLSFINIINYFVDIDISCYEYGSTCTFTCENSENKLISKCLDGEWDHPKVSFKGSNILRQIFLVENFSESSVEISETQ